MVGGITLVLLILGCVVFVVGRVPTALPGRAEAFASHVFLWKSSGVGLPKLCFCALVLNRDKLVIFVLGLPKVVIPRGELHRVQYHGGRGMIVETTQFRVWLFPRYVAEWHALIAHHLQRPDGPQG